MYANLSRADTGRCNSKPQDPKTTYPKMGKALNESGRHVRALIRTDPY
jgi:hypothetical protein